MGIIWSMRDQLSSVKSYSLPLELQQQEKKVKIRSGSCGLAEGCSTSMQNQNQQQASKATKDPPANFLAKTKHPPLCQPPLKIWPRLSPPSTGQGSCTPGSGFPYREKATKDKPAISEVSVLMNPGSTKLRETDLDVSEVNIS